jgi:hypothetical protein
MPLGQGRLEQLLAQVLQVLELEQVSLLPELLAGALGHWPVARLGMALA